MARRKKFIVSTVCRKDREEPSVRDIMHAALDDAVRHYARELELSSKRTRMKCEGSPDSHCLDEARMIRDSY